MVQEERRAVLEFKMGELKKRLLNLSTRNKLLSTKFSDRSRQHFRVIDELPNVLFEKIQKSLRFKSLPKLEDDPDDEQGQDFVDALNEGRLDDPQFLEEQRHLSEQEADESDPRWGESLRRLKDRTRIRLGMPRRTDLGRRISLRDHARNHGFDPSYDLPESRGNGDDPSKWQDDQIQLLMIPGEMERRVDAVRDTARSYEQERGVNVLGVAFGFLEWQEHGKSKSHYAPLILRSARLERKTTRQGYVYDIAATEDSAEDNETLRVRLRQDFGMELPALEPEESPEDYWARISDLLKGMPSWRVRRWVAVGVFPFENIVVTREIENNLETLIGRPLVGKILSVGGGNSASEATGDVRIESSEQDDAGSGMVGKLDKFLPLIADSDSSQEEAIRSVLEGRNLALKGPPGTGKSQTILNIIGAALAASKTVLFVAEKKAALEVVANRLRAAGLGELCLELHSDGTRPRNFLDSLGESLFYSAPPPPQEFESKKKQLRSQQKKLEQYVRQLGAPFGTTGHRVQEVFWHAREAMDRVKVPKTLLEFQIPGPDQFTDDDIQERLLCLENLVGTYELVFRAKDLDLNSHPWRGLGKETLVAFELDDMMSLLEEWVPACDAICGLLARNLLRESLRGDATLAELEALELSVAQIAPHVDSADPALLSQLGQEQARRELAHTLSLLERAVKARDEASRLVDLERCSIDEIRALSRELRNQSLNGVALRDLPGLLEDAQARLHEADGLSRAISELQEVLGAPEQRVADGAALGNFCECLSGVSDEVLAARHPDLTQPGLLRDLKSEADRLRKGRLDLQKRRLYVDRAPSPDILDGWAATLEAGGVFSFLSSEYRSVRKQWLRFSPGNRSLKSREAAMILRLLAQHLRDRKKFEEDETLKQLAGVRAKGVDTDFQLLEEARLYLEKSESLLPPYGDTKFLGEALRTTDARVLRLLRDRVVPQLRDGQLKTLSRYSSDLLIGEIVGLLGQEVASLQALCQMSEACEGADRAFDSEALDRAANLISKITSLEREARESRGASMLSPAILDISREVEGHVLKTLDVAERLAVADERIADLAFRDPRSLTPLRAELGSAVVEARRVVDIYRRLARAGEIRPRFWNDRDPSEVSFAEMLQRAVECSSDSKSLDGFAAWLRAVGEARSLGMSEFLDLYFDSGANVAELPACFQAVVRRAQVREALDRNGGILRRQNGTSQAQARAEFRRLDREVIELTRQALKSQLHSVTLPAGCDGPRAKDRTECNLLEHEYHKKRAYVPVRCLIRRASQTIGLAKPCFMMSPRSVSTYLPLEEFHFDLVIIDEASQMKPEFAIGALARADQAVIVGDPLQLPPTDFFSMSLKDEELDEEWEDEGIDEESVLDQALAVFRPSRTLRWHYRSRHQSLIAPSNHHIYGGELDLTPSPHLEEPGFGVARMRVDGLYQSGINTVEVDEVVDEALRIMEQRPECSLGIVTMNVKQRELIRETLDQAILRSSAARGYVEDWDSKDAGLESVFVKNLENVQGDERDIIIVSTVYGPDESGGPPKQRFGPINGAYGHRRLNVLFTRARNQLILVTSLDSGDIRVNENSARGLKFFKSYLEYAETGRLETGNEEGRAPESPFERWVLERLETHGFEGVPQVGVAGYRIDIGVRHPSWPHGYIMGIECDGATYHSCASARDRDRLREEVLRGLGWDIYRIWSTDWFNDPKGETDRMVAALRAAIAAKRKAE